MAFICVCTRKYAVYVAVKYCIPLQRSHLSSKIVVFITANESSKAISRVIRAVTGQRSSPDSSCLVNKTKIKRSRLMTKPTKWHVRPVKTQISLGIRPVWSVFAVRMKKPWVLSYPLSAQRRLWSGWADAQVDLSLHWEHMPLCWFCHEAAQMHLIQKIELCDV